MPSVWQQRFSGYVKRVLDLRESTSLTALGDIMPVLPVLDAGDPELRYYRDELLGLYLQTQVAVAAQYAACAIFAPGHASGPAPNVKNMVLVLEKALVYTTAASGVEGIFLGQASLPGGTQPGVGAVRDRRVIGALAGVTIRPSTAVLQVRTNVARLGLQAVVRNPTGVNLWEVDLGVVLADGQGFAFECDTVNVALGVTWFWRERAAPGEA